MSTPASAKVTIVGPVNKSVGANTQDTAEVSCSGKKHVIGGGLEVGGTYGQMRVNSASPADGPDAGDVPDDLYRVDADNLTGSPLSVSAWAVCAKGKFKYRSKGFGFSGAVAQTVECHKNESVVGGGVATNGAYNQSWILDSYPQKGDDPKVEFWLIGVAPATSGSFDGVITVVCTKDWKTKIRVGDALPVQGTQRGTDGKACSSKQELVGGGERGSGALQFMTTNGPIFTPAEGWFAGMDNTLSFERIVTPIAICRKP